MFHHLPHLSEVKGGERRLCYVRSAKMVDVNAKPAKLELFEAHSLASHRKHDWWRGGRPPHPLLFSQTNMRVTPSRKEHCTSISITLEGKLSLYIQVCTSVEGILSPSWVARQPAWGA